MAGSTDDVVLDLELAVDFCGIAGLDGSTPPMEYASEASTATSYALAICVMPKSKFSFLTSDQTKI